MPDPLSPADSFARQVLFVMAGVFLLIGAASVLAPTLVSDFVNIELKDALARFDFRAVYGGLQLGLGLWIGVAALRKAWRLPALNLTMLALGGLLAGRLLSLALDAESPGVIGFGLMGLELAGLGVTVFAMIRLRRARAEEAAQERAAVQTEAP